MIGRELSAGIAKLASMAGAALMVTAVVLSHVPEADARGPGARGGGGARAGGGSVRHSGARRSRGARGGARAQPTRRSGGARTQPARRPAGAAPGRGAPGRGAAPARGAPRGGAAPARRGGATPGQARGRAGATRGRARHRSASRRGHARYSARKDARRDWRRWRRNRALFAIGVAIATRPRYSTTVVVTGSTYYYWGGVYYVRHGSGYVVVAPPPGAVVYAVPAYTTVTYVGSTPYYYADGAYYRATTAPAQEPEIPDDEVLEESEENPPMTEDDHNFEVVGPPVGATVPYLPDEAEKKIVNGKTYLVYEGSWYRAYVSEGDTIYQVVEDPTAGG